MRRAKGTPYCMAWCIENPDGEWISAITQDCELYAGCNQFEIDRRTRDVEQCRRALLSPSPPEDPPEWLLPIAKACADGYSALVARGIALVASRSSAAVNA